jgi:GAF domain-containing protein
MLDWLKRITAPPIFEGDEDKTRTASLLNTVLLTVLVLAVVFSLFSIALSRTLSTVVLLIIEGVMVLVVLGSRFLMRSGRVRLASILFSLMLWVIITLVAVASGGVRTPGFGLCLVVIVIAGLLLGGRAGFGFAGLSALAGLVMLYAEVSGLLREPAGSNTPAAAWGVFTASFVVGAATLNLATRSISTALVRAQRYAAELEEQRGQLENLVQKRTRDLVRRSNYLEATTEIAREVTSTLNRQQLLAQVARLVSERFACYHAGIFMLDATQQWAVLQAASSEGGQRMLARGHRLQVGSQGIVGYVTGRGVPRVALNVGADAVFSNNPDLPETRSEIALPLRARGQVIGALDMQSLELQAFGEEDIAVLQTLADQVALAINNAQLFEQAQAAVEAERRAAGEITGQAWQNLIRSQTKTLAYIRRQDGLTAADATFQPPAPPTGGPAPVQDEPTRLIVPIKVRDQVIGVMDANRPEGEWTSEQIALVETLTEQLGVALESARLYQDTQRTAAQERVIGEVAGRIRETLDIETVLKTTASEIRQALDLDTLVIRLATPEIDDASGPV